jgi:propionate CoA-transferase
VKLAGNKLVIVHEGRHKKFRKKVFEKTFAASSAGRRPIKYITERAVFVLQEGRGVELSEIAPGVDLERDVLAHMGFRPLIREPLKLMDARCFGL